MRSLCAFLVLLLQTAAPEPAPEGLPVELFNGRNLDGWRPLGDAVWTVEVGTDGEPELVGAVGGGAQSFLASERTFADFRLEVELKNELPGNSGIQIRSHENGAGRLFGYQVEIDPSERAWSGGLYDEARRGWLQNLEGRGSARAAFRPGEWNRYAIECRGPWIRTWVNGVPITDYLDPLDLEGHFGLQVHSGDDTRVRWRSFELTDLGRHAWRAVADGDTGFERCAHRGCARACSVEARGLPELGGLRWSQDTDRQHAVLRLGPLAVRARELSLLVSGLGDTEGAPRDVAPPAGDTPPRTREVSVVRRGSRLALHVDGRLAWWTDGLPAGPLPVSFRNGEGPVTPEERYVDVLALDVLVQAAD